MGLPLWLNSRESACSAGNSGDGGSIPREGSSSGVGNGNPVFLPGKFHGQRSLTGYCPWGHKESNTAEHTWHTGIYSPSFVVLEKTLESPLDCKEIQPVHPKGDQSWPFTGRTDAEAETPILWPPDAMSRFI